jgi:hypothetical protein
VRVAAGRTREKQLMMKASRADEKAEMIAAD